ncbi:MAG: DUF4263 domain-containing protein [Sedimentisphaerales bacterium]|nr:DUF4263 domain-containing protein [Sedimentisphaerales bacterium]
MNDGEYAINKNPNFTYVSRPIGKEGNIRYISKVFNLEDFKDFYYEQKEKKVFEVIRESSTQEVTAIYNEDTNGFSLRIQRFSKKTGAPHNQSFSFHSGALNRFLKFIESLDLLDLSSVQKQRFSDKKIDELIESKKALTQLLEVPQCLTPEQLFQLFNKIGKNEQKELFQKFIDNIELYEIESLDAAIKQKEYKKSLKALEKLIEIENDSNFIDLVKSDNELNKYQANQPEKIFQNWIENNLWIFGVEYHKKHSFRKIGEDNSQADIILETIDGFLSLIEIKRPNPKFNLFRYDNSHRCFFPTSDFSEAIGQCLIYLQRIEDYKKTLEQEHSVRILRPRIRLIIGRTKNFKKEENEALHFLNSSLHDIDIISYDQLLENGNRIISFYDNNRGNGGASPNLPIQS